MLTRLVYFNNDRTDFLKLNTETEEKLETNVDLYEESIKKIARPLNFSWEMPLNENTCLK